MHGRNDRLTKLSEARTRAILAQLPRDKVSLITGLSKDWRDIEDGVFAAVTEALRVSVRIYGHGAITEDLPILLQHPDQYTDIAHQSYIRRAISDAPPFLRASQVRQLFPGIEFTDEDMRSMLRHAATQVKRTPDEPKLVVVSLDGDLVVTFAT